VDVSPASDIKQRQFLIVFAVSLLLHFVLALTTLRSGALGKAAPLSAAESALPTQLLSLKDLLAQNPNAGWLVDIEDNAPGLKEKVDSPYLSDRNRRAERQTQARNTSPSPGPSSPPPPQGEADGSAAAGADVQFNPGAGLTRLDRGEKKAAGRRRGLASGLNLSLPDRFLSQIGGQPTNYLPEIAFGEETLLSTREFKYSSFFVQMKRQMEATWHPQAILRQADPRGRDHFETVLEIVLNATGALDSARVVRSSGLTPLDDEALRTVRDASPYVNPPKELADAAGRIVIPRWHFIITSYFSL
jgi:TonB family protein